jgi:broad specificity phosphatase PhoE
MAHQTKVHFIRHGHVRNDAGLYYGRRPGFPLSEEGFRQAQSAADVLRCEPIAAVLASPLLRARQTASVVATAHPELCVTAHPLLIEVKSPFEGQPMAALKNRKYDHYTGFGPPYEQPGDVLSRMGQLMAELEMQYAGQHVVAVTHGSVIVLVMLWALGLPFTPDGKQELYDEYLSPGSITTFLIGADGGRPVYEPRTAARGNRQRVR